MFNENPTKLSSQNVVTQDVITAATILWLVKKLGNIYKNVILNGPILSHPSTDHPNHYITFIEISRLDKEFFLIGKSILLCYTFST